MRPEAPPEDGQGLDFPDPPLCFLDSLGSRHSDPALGDINKMLFDSPSGGSSSASGRGTPPP